MQYDITLFPLVYKERYHRLCISDFHCPSSQAFSSIPSRMKQIAIFILCALVHFCSSQTELDKDFCTIDHGANIGKLEEISSQLTGLITTLKKELKCRKPGQMLNPVSSCKDLPPASSSGKYMIRPECGQAFEAYCDVSSRCNSSTGGWMRVANLDMTDSSQQCPDGFRLVSRSTAPRRTCGRRVSDGCQSVVFPVNGTQYSKVCGRVKAYQYASPDGFFQYSSSRYLNSNYVDGVSITHGTSSRTHIWTFAAAWRIGACPCARSDYEVSVPSFIGNDYFCETGHKNSWSGRYYPESIFWDGVGCESTSTCCTFNSPPWFCKDLPQPTTDDIELRLCGDQGTGDEDTPIEAIEIYVY